MATLRDDDQPVPPEMQRWLETIPREERQEVLKTWQLAGVASDARFEGETDNTRTEAACARFRAVLETNSAGAASQKVELVSRHPGRSRAARPNASRRGRRRLLTAIMLLVAVVGAYAWLRPLHVEAPAGAITTVVLPDGSDVILNSASSLEYRRRMWGAERKVRLEGEAFFEVAPGERPFVIETFNAELRVLGTRFNVRARTEENSGGTAVVVASGRVELSAASRPETAVALTSDQRSRVPVAGFAPTEPEKASAALSMVWTRGGFAALDEPLQAVLAEVERRYGVSIGALPSHVENEVISIYLQEAPDAEVVVADICALLGYEYTLTQDIFKITPRSSSQSR